MSTEPIDLPEWLDRLAFDKAAGERYQLGTKPPGGVFSAATYANPVQNIAQDRDVWVGPNPVEQVFEGRPSADQVTRLAALHIDLDVKANGCPSYDVAKLIIDDLAGMLGTRPVAVTYSGHGVQPVWAVDEGQIVDWAGKGDRREPGDLLTRPEARALLRRWGRLVAAVAEKRGAKVDSLYDLTRILRCPGSVNHKYPDAPVPVYSFSDTGAPLDVEHVLEVLDEFNVPAMDEDTRDPGAVVSAPADWTYAASTCRYAAQMGAQWALDNPEARHPWLVAQAVRVAAAHRNGCVDEPGRAMLAAQLINRFHQLLGRDGRPAGPGEIADAFGWGQMATAAMSAQHLASELGYHTHTPPLTAAEQEITSDDPFGLGAPAGTVHGVPDGPVRADDRTEHHGMAAGPPDMGDGGRVDTAAAGPGGDPFGFDMPDLPVDVPATAHEAGRDLPTPPLAHVDLTPAERAARELFDLRVADEADKLRVRDAARQMYAEQTGPSVADLSTLYLDVADLARLPKPDPLIDGVLMRHTLAILRGRDGTYKSFVAIDWSLSLATGRSWQGLDTERVKVMYVAGEGAYGIADRVEAWEMAWRNKAAPGWFTLRTAAVNLFKGGPALDDLITRIEEGEYGLVVVDTLRRASGGADGNGSDMGIIIDNLDRIKRATLNGSVLTIAHTDKGDNDTRGYSGIEDDSDIVWHAKRDEETSGLDLVNAKMKDGPDGVTFPLVVTKVDLPSLDGKPRSSLVLASRNAPPVNAERESDGKVLGVLAEMFATTGASVAELIEVTGLSRSAVYAARGRLERAGRITVTARGAGHVIKLSGDTPGQDTPYDRPREAVDKGADSTGSRGHRVDGFHGPQNDVYAGQGILSPRVHGQSTDIPRGVHASPVPKGREGMDTDKDDPFGFGVLFSRQAG